MKICRTEIRKGRVEGRRKVGNGEERRKGRREEGREGGKERRKEKERGREKIRKEQGKGRREGGRWELLPAFSESVVGIRFSTLVIFSKVMHPSPTAEGIEHS